MITQDQFPVEPWQVREIGLNFDLLAQTESLFALSNGHIGVRATLDEGEPNALPGTYLNSFCETRPLPYAEPGFGYPESGETIVNVTDGKLIRLLVDDEPFDMRYGKLIHHERVLDLRAGILRREVEWQSPAGRRVRMHSQRLVSLTQRAVMAIDWTIEALDEPIRVVAQSELIANEQLPAQSKDPRVAAALQDALVADEHRGDGMRAELAHHTRNSGSQLAVAMDHVVNISDGHHTGLEIHEDWARMSIGCLLQPGESLRLTKFVAYGWSSRRSSAAIRDQVDAALAAAMYTGWEQLVRDQREHLDRFWHNADVRMEGDPAVQQAVRFGLFHVYQAGARAEQRPIAAKGLTGPGYDGHAFWDTEAFVLPVLTATAPKTVANALQWRLRTIDDARERARTLGWRGVAFPWRTILGKECSAYWPAGTAAVHVNGDIAAAASRYLRWTGDAGFEAEVALPILLETARLWRHLGYFGPDERFHIDGVTGPDEYSALIDDNAYTNLIAAGNLVDAADLAQRYPDRAAELEVTAEEIAKWRVAAAAIAVPRSANGMPEQFRGATERELWDFDKSEAFYPLLLHESYFDLYRRQVVKQADLMLAMHWRGDAYTFEEKARAFAYYEQLTVRDSSLSACTQAILAAETGHLALARDYLREAAMMDLHDLEHNTRDGLHIASLAGSWLAVVAGFGGLRDCGDLLAFTPQRPPGIDEFEFAITWQGACLHVRVGDHVTYSRDRGRDEDDPVAFSHHGERLELRNGESVIRPLVRVEPITATPMQPRGRAPLASDAG